MPNPVSRKMKSYCAICGCKYEHWICYRDTRKHCSRECASEARRRARFVLKDRDQLVVLYSMKRLTACKIAERLKCHYITVLKALKRFGIPRRVGRYKNGLECVDCGKPTITYQIFGEKRQSSRCRFHHRLHVAEKSRVSMETLRRKRGVPVRASVTSTARADQEQGSRIGVLPPRQVPKSKRNSK